MAWFGKHPHFPDEYGLEMTAYEGRSMSYVALKIRAPTGDRKTLGAVVPFGRLELIQLGFGLIWMAIFPKNGSPNLLD